MKKLTFEEMKDKKVIQLPVDKVTLPIEEAVKQAKANLKKEEITPDELIGFTFSWSFGDIKDISIPSENIFAINVEGDNTYTHLVYNKNSIIADEYFYNDEESKLEWYSRCEVELKDVSTFQIDWSYSDSFAQYLTESNSEFLHNINTTLKINVLISLDLYAKSNCLVNQ